MNDITGKVMCFGEVLWDLLPQGKKIGGAPLNAAYHLQKLGIPAFLVSRIGKDRYGDDIRKFLQRKGLHQAILQTDSYHPTGKVGVSFQPGGEISYEIYKDAAWDYIELTGDLEKIIDETKYIVFGSLITRQEVSRQTLFDILDRVPFKIMDVNLRAPFYSRPVIEELLDRADMVKMNEAELDIIAPWFNAGGDPKNQVERLCNRFHLKAIIVTSGDKGASVFSGGDYIFKKAYQVNVADTVGSGDAFLSGFLSEYLNNASLQQSLETAVRMGALVAQRPGGCPEYQTEDIGQITEGASPVRRE